MNTLYHTIYYPKSNLFSLILNCIEMKKYLLIFLLINICSVKCFSQETIGNANEFKTKITGNPSGKFILTANFVLPTDWTPISTFKGELNGQGHTITNTNNKANPALFDISDGASIQKLTYICGKAIIETISRNGLFQWQDFSRGAIVNTAKNTIIQNCIIQLNYSFINTGLFNNLYLGGIIGYASEKNEISDCIVKNSILKVERKDGNILSEGRSGGIIGNISDNKTTITNCIIINTTTEITGANGSESDFAGNKDKDSSINDNNTNAGTDIPEKEVEDILNNNGDTGSTTLLTVDLSNLVNPDASKITVEKITGASLSRM